MDDVILRVDDVPQTNEIRAQNIYDSQIVCTNDWMISYGFSDVITQVTKRRDRLYIMQNYLSGCLYKFYFTDQTWRILPCTNLPKFFHYSMVLLNQRHLVIHGTTLEDRSVYRTYIGDLTERGMIVFHCKASLITPHFLEYGEQKIITDNDFLYALTGRKISRSREASVFRLDLGTHYEWTCLYASAARIFTRTYYDLFAGQNVVFHDHQIFVFPSRGLDDVAALSVFDLRTSDAWRRAETTHDGGPDAGPHAPDRANANTAHSAAAQCPAEPRHVYVQTANVLGGLQAWTVWRLDLDTLRWARLRARGPQLNERVFRQLGAAVAPSGRMYTMRAGFPARRRSLRVFGASVRAPRLEDRAFEIVADLWRRARAAGRDPLSVFGQLPPSLARRLRDPPEET